MAEFIARNHDRIVDTWQQFAEMLPSLDGRVSAAELREHAGHLLDAVVDDMRSPPQPFAAVPAERPDARGAGGSEHGLQRHAAGLSLVALISEFRALRAVVLRLWAGAGFVRSAGAFDDLLMFNESLDRITADAVLAFAQAAERDRALVMGIVAHDLRGPLQTASMASHILAYRHPSVGEDETLGQLRRSLARMVPMVDDLMSVAASGLRGPMNVQPVRMDLTALAAELVSEVTAEFPAHRFALEAAGPHVGNWDKARLGQLVSNLLRNAAVHGDPSGVVRIALREDQDSVVLSVHNRGPVIPEAERAGLFSPAARGSTAKSGPHLGLGLFIVREIARGHGGDVSVSSDAEHGTVFSVVLPLDATTRDVAVDAAGANGAFIGAVAQSCEGAGGRVDRPQWNADA
nr:sensor histidine kinase [Tahibacter caeni]